MAALAAATAVPTLTPAPTAPPPTNPPTVFKVSAETIPPNDLDKASAPLSICLPVSGLVNWYSPVSLLYDIKPAASAFSSASFCP